MAGIEFRTIMKHNIPCWYELSWRPELPAIVLRVRKDFAEYISESTKLSDETPAVAELAERFRFKKFDADLRSKFGFDDAFEPAKDDGDFFSFVIRIPCVRHFTENPCRMFSTSGKLGHSEECVCGGTGKDYEYRQKPLFAISASLAVFSFFARYGYQPSEFVTSASKPQILLFTLSADTGMHGSYINGEYSIALIRWLRTSLFTSREREPVIRTVRNASISAHRKMCGMVMEFEDFEFRIALHGDGEFHISVPGDACGIDPGYRYTRYSIDSEGYEFSGHNVDSPIQQIAILAGLSALHDSARLQGV